MQHGIRLEIAWTDEDFVALSVAGASGCFAGSTYAYIAPADLGRVAAAFRGFPESTSDEREVVLGSIEGAAGPGVRFRLRCSNAAGHAAVALLVRTDPREHAGLAESAEFVVPVEAAAIDGFAQAVEDMTPVTGARAFLPAVG